MYAVCSSCGCARVHVQERDNKTTQQFIAIGLRLLEEREREREREREGWIVYCLLLKTALSTTGNKTNVSFHAYAPINSEKIIHNYAE